MVNCRSDVAFGSFLLNMPPYYIDDMQVYHAPAHQINRQPQLMQPGSMASNTRYDEKIVELRGRIVGLTNTGRATMVRRLDRLQMALSSGPAALKVGYADERYYKDAIIIDSADANWSDQAPNQIDWTARFLAADPFLYAAAESIDAPGLTVLTLT